MGVADEGMFTRKVRPGSRGLPLAFLGIQSGSVQFWLQAMTVGASVATSVSHTDGDMKKPCSFLQTIPVQSTGVYTYNGIGMCSCTVSLRVPCINIGHMTLYVEGGLPRQPLSYCRLVRYGRG